MTKTEMVVKLLEDACEEAWNAIELDKDMIQSGDAPKFWEQELTKDRYLWGKLSLLADKAHKMIANE